MEGNSQPWLLAGKTEPCKVPARESELLQCTAKPFSCSPCAREDRGQGAELLSARHTQETTSSASEHMEEAIGQGTHWIKHGSLWAPHVAQKLPSSVLPF